MTPLHQSLIARLGELRAPLRIVLEVERWLQRGGVVERWQEITEAIAVTWVPGSLPAPWSEPGHMLDPADPVGGWGYSHLWEPGATSVRTSVLALGWGS